jgi:pSer/pThr/pTyr-binding forkhead associated (FHA) protein
VDVKLVLKQGPARTRVIRLRTAETLIGRSRECDICIPSAAVSRRHCLLCVSGSQLTVEDLSSHNGTFLNRERITSKRMVLSGDQLQIGPLLFTIETQASRAAMETLVSRPRQTDVPEESTRKPKTDVPDSKPPSISTIPTIAPEGPEEDVEIIMNDAHPLDLPEGDDFRDLLSKLDLE